VVRDQVSRSGVPEQLDDLVSPSLTQVVEDHTT
jgi:hypothetical protein